MAQVGLCSEAVYRNGAVCVEKKQFTTMKSKVASNMSASSGGGHLRPKPTGNGDLPRKAFPCGQPAKREGQAPKPQVNGKRLGNTPFRREACVVKWLDE